MKPGAAIVDQAGSRAGSAPTAQRNPLAGLLAQARTLQRRFDRRTQRERLLLMAGAAALALLAADALWLGPALVEFNSAHRQQQEVQATLATLQADAQTLRDQGSAQARHQQAELDSWRQRVRSGDAALRRHEDALVGPDHMLALLSQLLVRQGPVRVRALRSLGRHDLLQPAAGQAPDAPAPAATAAAGGSPAGANSQPGEPANSSATAQPATLYRHGVELELEGGFNDLLAYLLAAEALPQRMLWGSISLKVALHPTSVLTLRVYTLSRDRHWLEI